MKGIHLLARAQQFAADFLIGIAVFLFILVLAFSEHHTALSAPAFHIKADTGDRQSRAQVSPANVTSGTLFVAAPANMVGPTLAQTVHTSSDIEISVNGPLARVIVTQKFANNTGLDGRGIFAFPLPKDAAIDTLVVQAGERHIKSRIVGQAEAERFFQNARSAGQAISLPASSHPGTTSVSINKINAGTDITVRFEYLQALQISAGSAALEFPLARSAPSHNEALPLSASIDTTPHTAIAENIAPDAAKDDSATVSLRVRLNAGFPLGKIQSATHEISIRKAADGTAIIELARARIATDRNFELTWQPQKSGKTQLAAFKETNGKNNHILAQLTAPDATHGAGSHPREVIFTVDTSGSMAGPSLKQLKRSLSAALMKLTPRDRFNIIQFNSQSEKLFDEAEPATSESLAVAMTFVAGLEARGGTEALPALDAALTDNRKNGDRRVRQIIFVTDGEIAGAAEFLSRIAQKRGRSRLFMVGIGSDISLAIMHRAAEIGRGSFVHIDGRNTVHSRLAALLDKLQQPVVTDLRVEWPNGVRTDAWPNPLPDLYANETLLISGELSALKGDLKVTGNLGGQPWSKTFSLANAVNGKGISRFWARHKIASLQARTYAGQTQADVDSAVEAIALEHGVVSSRTMLIGLDTPPARTNRQPPAGETLPETPPSVWVDDGISRLPAADYERDRSLTRTDPEANKDRSLVTSSITGKASDQDDRNLKVAIRTGGIGPAPAESTLTKNEIGAQTWALSIMALVFALMTAMTLGLWRHLRHAVEHRRRGKRVT